MTSAHKLFVGAAITAAAVLTARHLHQSDATEPRPKTLAAPTSKLTWRRPTGASSVSTLWTKLSPSAALPAGVARLTSAEEPVAPPDPAAFAEEIESAGGSNLAGFRDAPIPFALSEPEPRTGMVAVDEEDEAREESSGEYVYHTAQFGETLPEIALRYTGRRDTYMAIYQANLDVLDSPAGVPPGAVLRIPVRP